MLSGLRNRAARFLQRPGTADLGNYRALLPAIAEREHAVAALTDSELTAAARRGDKRRPGSARLAARRPDAG